MLEDSKVATGGDSAQDNGGYNSEILCGKHKASTFKTPQFCLLCTDRLGTVRLEVQSPLLEKLQLARY